MNLSTIYLKQRETWKLEGIEEGRELGIQLGQQEGRQETLKTVAIALLREGVDLELILKTTGIDPETLRTLQSQLT